MSYKKEKCDAAKRDAIWSFLLLYIKKMYRYSTTYSMTSSTTVISLHALRYQYKYGSPIGPCHYCITIITHGSTLLSGTMENQNMGTRHRLNNYSSGHRWSSVPRVKCDNESGCSPRTEPAVVNS